MSARPLPQRISPRTRVPLHRSVAGPVGHLLLLLAAMMALCAAASPLMGTWAGVAAMLGSAGVSAVVGGLLTWWGRAAPERIGRKEGFVFVALTWLLTCVLGALPFVIETGLGPVDALFEATSGFTTTGATILPAIELRLSPAVHLWRLATHWLGGLGIVVLFVALFPAMGVGGRHLFFTEAPGPGKEGLAPRIRDTASVLWRVYVLLTLAEVLLLLLVGMPLFDAVGHALSTMGTGGFSTKDGSVGEYASWSVDLVITAFMLVAGTNFALFHQARLRGLKALTRNTELRVYLGLFLAATLVVSLDIWRTVHPQLLEALRYGAFQVAAILTTTGFGTDDYEQWPALSKTVLVFLFFVGGSAGSTAGGMKVVRIVVMIRLIGIELRRATRPALVAPVRLGRQVVPQGTVIEIAGYLAVFLFTVVAGGLGVALMEDTDLITALMAALACVANVGPGLGDVGPTDNFAWLSSGSKVLLSLLMLLGRLEFFALLVLLTPTFWRR